MEKQTKKLKRRVGIVLVLVVALVVMIILRRFEKIGGFLHINLSANIVASVGKFTSLIPFSTYEFFLYAIGIFLLYTIVVAIINLAKRRYKKCLIKVTSIAIAVLTFANIYFASAGFAYKQYNQNLTFEEYYAPHSQLAQMADYFLADFNALAQKFERDENGVIVQPYSDQELAKKMVEEFKRINIDGLYAYTPLCKTIFSSTLMSEMHVSGVFFAPLGEANINGLMPPSEKPFTMAHELAHAKGVMREDEANMVATALTLTSADDYIRYSGYMERITYFFDTFYLYNDVESANYYYGQISPLVKEEWAEGFRHWVSFDRLDGIVSRFTSVFIDFYLRVMGQDEGSGAYSPGTGTPIDPNPVPDPNPVDPLPNPDPSDIYPIFTPTQRLFFNIYQDLNLVDSPED